MAAANIPELHVDTKRFPIALFGRVNRRLRYRLDARLEGYGLTGVQWGLLARLAEQDGLSQTTLQHAMAIEGATLTHILQRLEREDWINRTCDPVDRRRQQVWLTAKSRQLVPEIAALVEIHRTQAQAGLSEDDLAQLARLLTRIEENLV